MILFQYLQKDFSIVAAVLYVIVLGRTNIAEWQMEGNYFQKLTLGICDVCIEIGLKLIHFTGKLFQLAKEIFQLYVCVKMKM